MMVMFFQLPVRQDNPPFLKHFGDVLKDVNVASPYRAGDTVTVQFVGSVTSHGLHDHI